MTADNDILKMSIITIIRMMEEKVNMPRPYTFEQLWRMDQDQLQVIRDTRIEHYNGIVKGD